ncbi:hypothetical protein N7520_005258 [Penicillium odoratum]|uniref:uncharacterized protein n=1 Tax=Penicillium odoratum TaxID=1167516 RepID=UPI002546BDF6|nr:uncharacterized protein N7520_005258 [Penicillium odoratum]KAJ5765699.1 hypothetical protein N7520_005258 [Penicillium odoratum]
MAGVCEEEGLSAADDLPACQSCRRRKLKCSRQTPSCAQCERLAFECVYVSKQKPGVKTGAVDSLGRRLDVLERILLDETGRRKAQLAFLDLDPEHVDENQFTSLQSQTSDKEARVVESAVSPRHASQSNHKRRRTNSVNPNLCEDDEIPPLPPLPLLDAIVNAHFLTVHHWIPILHQRRFRARLQDPQERSRLSVLLHSLVAAAIKYVELDKCGLSHEDVESQIRVSRRTVLLHAMQSLSVESMQALVVLAFDYMGCGNPSKAWPIIGSLTRTVEYLQLIVEPADLPLQKQPLLRPLMLLPLPRDWTESEEQRRLFWNVFLLDRLDNLKTCNEEFMIDPIIAEFAQSLPGSWHTCLTSNHVQRRLPCCGAPWAREEAVLTPFFGIWNNSTANIGRSIANIPALYESSSNSNYSPGSAAGGGSGGDQLDTSNLGAFAYCIEATENLSQVTSFFLQQSIDFGDTQQVKNWLMRFKELDLRLVHWKMFLPHQWNDSDVSRDISVVKMDPNLTLAHLTHNAAMILLHQHVAYPPTTWCGVIKLPSACSAETCQLAAVEIASITDKYLCFMGGIVNNQFAFCAFVAARVLLAHWLSAQETGDPLAYEFFSLIDSLRNMSRRWMGFYSREGTNMGDGDGNNVGPSGSDMMAKYATQLQLMHSQYAAGLGAHSSVGDMLSDSSLDGLLNKQQNMANDEPSRPDITFPSMSDVDPGAMIPGSSSFTPYIHPTGSLLKPPAHQHPPSTYDSQHTLIRSGDVRSRQQSRNTQRRTHYGTNTAMTGAPSTMMTSSPSTAAVAGLMELGMDSNRSNRNSAAGEDDELTAMSHMLLGQQFLELDRVITLNGTDFFGSYTSGDSGGVLSYGLDK